MLAYLKIIKNALSAERQFFQSMYNLTGFYPRNLRLYKLAFVHKSIMREQNQGKYLSNERLEYLGDAVLGAVVADLLFKKFPYRNEGFLTEMRSRIVSRDSLKHVAIKMGIKAWVANIENSSSRSMYGDALEALIGAVYLDCGYKAAQQFVLNRIIQIHMDLEEKETNDTNFKSRLINHAQKEKHELLFDMVQDEQAGRQFTISIKYNGAEIARATEYSKKRAEQQAAAIACKALELL
ncbi:MAG TPA: ribonuclease III [Bacteroidia bacterium]|nr:ribonuclease III [Bacteroidia bacterium]